MAKQTITINSIFGGIQSNYNFGGNDQYLAGIAIDPDASANIGSGSVISSLSGGSIAPVAYKRFSSTYVSATPIAIYSIPQNSGSTYAVLSNGRFIEYKTTDLSLSGLTEEFITTVTGSVADSSIYYNNYNYIFTENDVSRYVPLDVGAGLSVMTNTVWTGATLGTQTALTNQVLPTMRHSVKYPSHAPFVHPADGRLYFCDGGNTAATAGKGIINYIKTTKTASNGDTNDGSKYDALTLPPYWLPSSITNLGSNLVIAANTYNNTSGLAQGPNAALFIWDTISPSVSRMIPLPDPFCSAIFNHNGRVYGWSGWTDLSYGKTRFWVYDGGFSVKTIFFTPDSYPPRHSAVAAYGERIVWAGMTTRSPASSASVFAYGSNTGLISTGVHNIATSTLTTSAVLGVITAIAPFTTSAPTSTFSPGDINMTLVDLLFGGTDGTNFHICKRGTNGDYQTSYWRSKVYNIGRPFKIKKIRLNSSVTAGVAANITPTLFFDNDAKSSVGSAINPTNFGYQNYSMFNITLTEPDFGGDTGGRYNFNLELAFTSTSRSSVTLPITIELEISDNEYDVKNY